FGLPLIEINDHPFMLFNFFERRFIIFGVAFWPQDFHIFLIAMIAFFVFIILFTVVFGRLWCGWACPQTIFMEMVFRKIEYWIEGDAIQQKRLEKAPWNSKKIFKKATKHFIFLLISIVIAHTLMSYLISFEQVKEVVTSSPTENMAGFIGMVFFTGLFYFVFSYLREQACVAICPYGRLQGVLLVKDSIVVAYDWIRGEPRGKLKKGKIQEDKGDCIACKRCVHVCPTGIDIRNGTQLECVNCTACMDACDEVMETIEKPKGLIRYASYNSIKEGKKKLLDARVAAYSVVLVAILGLLALLLATRTDVETSVRRVPGTLYQEQENGVISNLYNLKFINKTFEKKNLRVQIKEEDGVIRGVTDEEINIEANANAEGVFFIEFPKEKITESKTEVTVQVLEEGEVVDEVSTNFLGPLKF
ncbi:MAG: cytochrome c oxidase accessory protein CcoG, partial [Cyclobacteriaceae bacterium]